MCVMCSTSVPTLFQYFIYDHIPTFLYIFHEMFITCNYYKLYVLCKLYFDNQLIIIIMKNVKECRDVNRQSIRTRSGCYRNTSHPFDLIALYDSDDTMGKSV